jgi:hypothetical protein
MSNFWHPSLILIVSALLIPLIRSGFGRRMLIVPIVVFGAIVSLRKACSGRWISWVGLWCSAVSTS